ncbi:MAG: 2-oxoglutarate dehydrogenase E1 component [Deferrisomatales bacterium]|nr:2-oxoglutarate dehydrogenase E1 component [Deferrisomatales bacterium]
MDVPGGWNLTYVDEQFSRWRADPGSVSPQWQAFFQGFELGTARPTLEGGGEALDAQVLQARADALIHRYRDLGHLLACLDPLSVCPTSHPLLELEAFGLSPEDLERTVYAPGLGEGDHTALGDVVQALRETYCRSVGVEYTHLQDPEERRWMRARMEPGRNRGRFSREERREVLRWMVRAGRFEEFLHKRYLGQTRFSLEGGEVLIPQLRSLVRGAAERGVRQVILGMAHRGRLNVHVNLLGKGFEEVFCQFEATYDPEEVPGGGDVKYHSGYMGEVETGAGKVRMILPENPSHLEAVNPVVEGVARALQDGLGEGGGRAVLPILIHGDAAFPGQGIVAETLNLAQLPGYATGGTVHIVLNNQIGYTTLPEHARSTRYATDVAKMLMVPIFHVQGESPEAVLHATTIALEYRLEFGKDAVLDLVCYRRHGHNEGDEPYFTQPLLYERIRDRPPAYELYARELAEAKVVEAGELESLRAEVDQELDAAFEAARSAACTWTPPEPWDGWERSENRHSWEPVATALPEEELRELYRAVARVPEGFALNPKLRRILERREQAAEEEEGARLDWAAAEALAFGSLLVEGTPVRLSGEDSGRGTFSQRHAVWFDTETGEPRVPLNHLREGQARFQVFDSPLSEAAVVGFEYGYAAVSPQALVLWEAQYGDFANGAQVIIDQFLASAEAKWQRPNGLVLLLPHGYEGQGPDHSTARPERFLQLCAEENLQVCQPSTPAQYFHLLRRQVKAPWRKPLVVLTPKSLLRHPEAVSPLSALTSGGFAPVLDDPDAGRPSAVRRVLLCSGKIYYSLAKRRSQVDAAGVALARLEQLYPFPEQALEELAARYGRATEWLWVQDEPVNMGAWTFVAPRLRAALGREPKFVGRAEAASPATGFSFLHRAEEEKLLAEALPGKEEGSAGGGGKAKGKGGGAKSGGGEKRRTSKE